MFSTTFVSTALMASQRLSSQRLASQRHSSQRWSWQRLSSQHWWLHSGCLQWSSRLFEITSFICFYPHFEVFEKLPIWNFLTPAFDLIFFGKCLKFIWSPMNVLITDFIQNMSQAPSMWIKTDKWDILKKPYLEIKNNNFVLASYESLKRLEC